ncbi:DUF1836 domain-containing protein [Metabacillus sp. GX 13764]|uniref:DUF1836 domain-containing protein n=1 Tax=Metabacillus kandeliae TaxID=2900151 RepID=UPI001E2B8546|nr:DUF1836 domain-containing protein [Metabacillus kandeliae]MCD7036182.1 DUF1836 domain-containing protein [Metabacillus kandeliae]
MQNAFSRKEIGELFLSMKGEGKKYLKELIQQAELDELPDILVRIVDGQQPYGFSSNEIVELANLCDCGTLSSASIQNWIKRDIKELIGPPEHGKKYSVDQAAILLLVWDLKSLYDFSAIRSLLTYLFNTISDRSDDVIGPALFYALCGYVLDKISGAPIQSFDEKEFRLAIEQAKTAFTLADFIWEHIEDVLILVLLAVSASRLHQQSAAILERHLRRMECGE